MLCFPQLNFFNMKKYIFAFEVGDNLSNLVFNLTDPFFRARDSKSRLT